MEWVLTRGLDDLMPVWKGPFRINDFGIAAAVATGGSLSDSSSDDSSTSLLDDLTPPFDVASDVLTNLDTNGR
jgi:hypothetical protein